MRLLEAVIKQAPNKVLISIILGGFSGICYAFLIPIVLSIIDTKKSNNSFTLDNNFVFFNLEISHHKVALLFVLMCLAILITRSLSQVILTRVSLDMTTSLRKNLYTKIMSTSTDSISEMGYPKLIAVIISDVSRVVGGAVVIPDLIMNLVTIIGLLAFLLYLNSDIFYFVIYSIIFGIVAFQIPMSISRIFFSRSRHKVDDLHESIRGLILGFKELKINQEKENNYFNDVLIKNEDEVVRNEKMGSSIVKVAANFADMISFFIIGIIAFILTNYSPITGQELIGVIMVLLYITGPLGVIINAIPQILLARISLTKVNKVLAEIPIEEINQGIDPIESWDKLTLSGVRYKYKTSESSFEIGPIDLSIEKSSITFIVGGNGSGKSTIGKLLTLHNTPDSGHIKFGKIKINSLNIKSYRQTISSIYSDYYLFDRILNNKHNENKEKINSYLKLLGLESKVKIENNKFSTIKLSDGQKRRLALLVALLDDKEIYLFDEWAADQDPTFKEFFYYKVLPELKSKGKAIIVISHDDRYFKVADRLFFMENGKMKTSVPKEAGLHDHNKYEGSDRADVNEPGLA